MPKGPAITDEIKELVAKLHDKHPKWTNKKMRLEVQKIKHREDKELAEKWSKWPSPFSIDRIMAEVKKNKKLRLRNPDARDNAWTIQSIGEYPIPAEALPAVLEAWFHVQNLVSMGVPPLTIRQVQWAARLSATIKDTKALLTYSVLMADYEKQAEDAGLDYYGSPWDTLEVYGQMIGRTFTEEEKKRITGLPGHCLTHLGMKEASRIMASASLSGTGKLTCSATVTKAMRETRLRVKEVKHDRKHNEKR